MKIATFNVNSIVARLHVLIPWIKENRPDFLCIQETKVEDRKFPEAEFHRLGYHVIFRGKGGQSGVALASIEEPKKFSFGFPDGPKDDDRLIFAEFEKFRLVNVYVPQGYRIDSEKYTYKLKWLERFRDYLEKTGIKKLVVCGDMNVAPEDIDVHSPEKLRNHVCFHEDARKAYKKILELGLVDLLRKFNPNSRVYTFYDYRVKGAIERGLGWRVDAILASNDVDESCKACYADMRPRLAEKPSDHLPIIAEFGKKYK